MARKKQKQNWSKRLFALGVLRLTLLISSLIVLALIPTPGTPTIYGGWGLVTTVLAPVMAPILFMVVMFDVLMARVFFKEASRDKREHLKMVIVIDLLVAALLLLRWLPFFLSLRA